MCFHCIYVYICNKNTATLPLYNVWNKIKA